MNPRIYLLLLFIANYAAAQREQPNAPFTIRGNIGIPATISTQMFRTSFNGVYEANLSANFRVGKRMYAGLGYLNTFLQNNKEVFVYYKTPQGSLSYETKMMMHGAFLKAGIDRFFTNTAYVSYALNAGYTFGNYLKVQPDTIAANRPNGPLSISAPFVQPEVSLNFVVEGSMAFSVYLAYNTLFYKFEPKSPRFNHIAQVTQSTNAYFPSWITFGFGFTVLLNGK